MVIRRIIVLIAIYHFIAAVTLINLNEECNGLTKSRCENKERCVWMEDQINGVCVSWIDGRDRQLHTGTNITINERRSISNTYSQVSETNGKKLLNQTFESQGDNNSQLCNSFEEWITCESSTYCT